MPTTTEAPPAEADVAAGGKGKAPRKRAPRKAASAKGKAPEQTPEQEQGPLAAGSAPDAGAADEQPVAEPQEGDVEDVVQPGDVEDASKVGTVAIPARGFGVLTLSSDQRRLSDDQRAALVAIGIDTNKDPAVTPHVLPFIHMCQTRGLDPWAREAYLIGRGQGNNRKYTMQVGIDGYLKLAKATGRYIRVKEVLWTGSDDDDRSWTAVEANGRVVMRRVWWDQWPSTKGHPGSAEVTIEHYDEFGNITETTVVADWGMYAPYNAEWEDNGSGGRRKKRGPDGKDVMVLGEMWERGGPYMLSKCGIALAVRRAFPGATAGVYMHEEMHAADAAELRRLEQEGKNARMAAVQRLRSAEAQPEPVNPGKVVSPEEALLASPSAPMVIDVESTDAPTAAQGPLGTEGPEADEEQRKAWVLDEIDLMCDVLDTTPGKLMARWMTQHRKNPGDGTLAELLPFVAGLRPMAVTAMHERGDDLPASHWAQVRPDACGPVSWLLGAPTRDPQDGSGQRQTEREGGGPTVVGDVIPEVEEDLRGRRERMEEMADTVIRGDTP